MKKHLTFFPLALLFVFSACTADGYMNDRISEEDGDILSYRMYIEPFAGKWNFVSYDILTKTVVCDTDGTVRDNIQGRDTRDIEASWTFETDGWGVIALKKNPTYLPTGEATPNDNISPLLKYSKEFQWKVDNDSTMILKFYLTSESTETYEARYNWENWEEMSNADKKSPYWNDNLSLTVSYTTTGNYAELEKTYAGYTYFNTSYDGTGCTFKTDVTLTYYLQRN